MRFFQGYKQLLEMRKEPTMGPRIHLTALTVCLVCLSAIPVQPVQAGEPFPSASQVTVPTLEARDLQTLIKKKQRFFLIDVRQPDEFAAGHIDGAILMPLDKLPNTYRQIPKGVKLVVYCRSGHRSAEAVAFLRDHGYGKAVSLAGGYSAWAVTNHSLH